jgi:hypothetical protein
VCYLHEMATKMKVHHEYRKTYDLI